MDLAARGALVEGGHCEPSPPTFHEPGLVYAVRGPTEARFVVRDGETGEEQPIGAPRSHFLFARSVHRDGTWALSTSDGTDSFCLSGEPSWPEDPDAVGNTLQLLRPDDGVAHDLETGPNSFDFQARVSLAPGGWCAAIPAGPEWDAPLERFDLGTGERSPFPPGFAFGGWLD
ncbi:MAG: hypothetical protein AAF471_08175 [Myxococcota bacterium]